MTFSKLSSIFKKYKHTFVQKNKTFFESIYFVSTGSPCHTEGESYAIFAGKEASITAWFCWCFSHWDKKIQTEVIISGVKSGIVSLYIYRYIVIDIFKCWPCCCHWWCLQTTFIIVSLYMYSIIKWKCTAFIHFVRLICFNCEDILQLQKQ